MLLIMQSLEISLMTSFVFQVGDYVFVKSKLPTEISDDIVPEFDYCFVPGIIQVTPLRHSSASKCYTVLRHNGSKVRKM